MIDHAGSIGLSFMALIGTWFHVEVSKNLMVLTGAVILCLPLLRSGKWANRLNDDDLGGAAGESNY